MTIPVDLVRMGAGAESYLLSALAPDLNRLSRRERRFQRAGLTPAVARGRLLGGRVRTVRGARQVTGVESGAPPG